MQRIYSDGHRVVAGCAVCLADVYREQGRFEEASRLTEDALATHIGF